MGFLDRFRRTGPKRIDVPEQLPTAEVAELHVHTAEDLAVISTDAAGARALIHTASSRTAVQLICGDKRPVSLIPLSHDRSAPSLDPKLGWLIPLSPETCEEIVQVVSADPGGEYELNSLNLAVVVS